MTPADLRARAERLRAFVAAVHGVAADWDGCSTWPAQWVANERPDATVEWPVYADETEGRALIEREGGLLALWRRVAAGAGLMERFDGLADLGDIGVIETSRGQVGGIFTAGGGLAVRSVEGASIVGVVGRFHTFRIDGMPVRKPLVAGVWRV